MNTMTNPTPTVASSPKRIILASAYRHEKHSAKRQERALKSLHKMRHDDKEICPDHRIGWILSAEETLDD